MRKELLWVPVSCAGNENALKLDCGGGGTLCMIILKDTEVHTFSDGSGSLGQVEGVQAGHQRCPLPSSGDGQLSEAASLLDRADIPWPGWVCDAHLLCLAG